MWMSEVKMHISFYVNDLNEINLKLTSVDVISLGFAFGSSKYTA